ncbi:unnamed protein product [Mytilus coruscus]|uniref:Uncharacterized protein n=1 Tax=Mytilus coruscus TaxID=42192 RepID=A0A6J8EU89_MYTCO|nr:unnamed protein product [Mytilus coruscus]
MGVDKRGYNRGKCKDCECIEYETEVPEVETKLEKQQNEIEKKNLKIFFLESRNLRQKIRSVTLSKKIKEYSKQGSVKSVCYQLGLAHEKDVLQDKTVLCDLLKTMARNFHVKKKGKSDHVLGGPRLVNFIALNLDGPDVHSVYRWRKHELTRLDDCIQEKNFKILGEIYLNYESENVPQIPVLVAEDETAIVDENRYHQDFGSLLGFCGVNGNEHKCLDSFLVQVGAGIDGYNKIMNTFQN